MEISLQERKTDLTLIEVWFTFKEYPETDVYLIDDYGRMLLTKITEITQYGFGTTVNRFFIEEDILGEAYFILYITQHHYEDEEEEEWEENTLKI